MNRRQTNALVGCLSSFAFLLLLCIAGTMLLWWRGDQILALLGLSQQTRAARLLPADTQMYVGVSLNLRNQAGFENLNQLYFQNPDVQAFLEQSKGSLKEESTLDFDQDIAPWLGSEAAFAMPALTELRDPGAPPTDTPPFLVALATRDEAATNSALDKLQAQSADSADIEQRAHSGVAYRFDPPASEFDTEMAVAVFDGFLLMTNSETLLHGAIERSKSNGDGSLAEEARFQKVLGALPTESALLMVMDYSGFTKMIQESMPGTLPPEQLAAIEAMQMVGIGMTLQADGIQVDAAILTDESKLPPEALATFQRPASPNAILAQVPADAILVGSGNNINAIWAQMRSSLENTPEAAEGMAQMEQELGISLERDLFDWMTGEAAFVLTDVTLDSGDSLPVTGYLLADAGDLAAAQAGVDNMTTALTTMVGTEPQPRDIGGHSMRLMVDDFDGQELVAYGFVENRFVLGLQERSIRRMLEASSDPITNDAHFKAVNAHLPPSNSGIFFLDLDAVQGLIESQLSEDFGLEEYTTTVRPFLAPMHAVGAANSVGLEDGIARGRLFLLITGE